MCFVSAKFPDLSRRKCCTAWTAWWSDHPPLPGSSSVWSEFPHHTRSCSCSSCSRDPSPAQCRATPPSIIIDSRLSGLRLRLFTSSCVVKVCTPSTTRESAPDLERWRIVTWSLLRSGQDLGQPWTSSRGLQQKNVTLLISTEYLINY